MYNPLVSFCLKAYNQREYIGAALDGALAQTYRPLEIVICDDHSTDGTWEILREKVKKVGGDEQRTIVLHRNEENLGNARNWEQCGRLAHGELLIKADGDDISEPDRTAKVVDAWVKDGKRAKVISSACRVMDVDGHIIGERHDVGINAALGAVQAWSRDCFAGWPEIPATKALDDEVWCVRAKLLGGAEIVLPDLLVRYRKGCGVSTSGKCYRKTLARVFHAVTAAYSICRTDSDWYMSQGGDKSRSEAVRKAFEIRAQEAEAWFLVTEGRSVWARLRGVRCLWQGHGRRGHILTLLLVLPFRLGDPIINRFRKKV